MDRDVDQMYKKIFEMLAIVGRMEKPTEFDQRAGPDWQFKFLSKHLQNGAIFCNLLDELTRKWLFHSPKDKNRKFGRRIFCKEKFKKIFSSVENAIPANQAIAWRKRLFYASKFASRRHQKRLSS